MLTRTGTRLTIAKERPRPDLGKVPAPNQELVTDVFKLGRAAIVGGRSKRWATHLAHGSLSQLPPPAAA
jgi:hypothetical protein